MMLTVLHIFSGDLWAGAEVMINNLLRELQQQRGIKLIALSLNEGELTRRLREAGVETHVVPETRYSFAGIIREAFLLLRKRPIDVIHSHRYKENLIAFLLSRLIGVKRLISTLHGLPEATAGGAGVTAAFKRWLNFLLLRTYFLSVAVSDEMKSVLIKSYGFSPDRVTRIYNGIPVPQRSAISDQPSALNPFILSLDGLPEPQPASPLNLNLASHRDLNLDLNLSSSKTFHIGTVGRMVPVKDFDLFLETAAEIRKKMQNVRFSILGDGPLKAHLLEKAKVLGVDDAVSFLTPVENPQPFYLSLNLYLNTSVHEGIPMSILEAMSCGLPVVAPAVGGITEIIEDGDHGFLLSARAPEQFALCCIKMLLQPQLNAAISREGKNRVINDFSSKRMADRYAISYKGR